MKRPLFGILLLGLALAAGLWLRAALQPVPVRQLTVARHEAVSVGNPATIPTVRNEVVPIPAVTAEPAVTPAGTAAAVSFRIVRGQKEPATSPRCINGFSITDASKA